MAIEDKICPSCKSEDVASCGVTDFWCYKCNHVWDEGVQMTIGDLFKRMAEMPLDLPVKIWKQGSYQDPTGPSRKGLVTINNWTQTAITEKQREESFEAFVIE